MQTILKAICSATSFCMISAIVISIVPCKDGTKRMLSALAGIICLIMLFPLLKVDYKNLNQEIDIEASYSEEIEKYMIEQASKPIKTDISDKSKPIFDKYGINSAEIVLDAEIISESGIFVRSVNYIISDGLSSVEGLKGELINATGYNCNVEFRRKNE